MNNLEIMGIICVIVFAAVWFVISYGEWETSDPAKDPYLNYGSYQSAGAVFSWGFAIPAILSMLAISYSFYKLGWYAIYAITPILGTLFWIGHKIVRRSAQIPNQIAAAIVYLSNYETKRKPLEIGITRPIDTRLGKEHWGKTPFAIKPEYIYLNMDSRHYKLPWKAIRGLERTQIKPPNTESYIPGLRIRLPTEIESTIVLAMTEKEINYVMATLNPRLHEEAV